MIENVVVKSKRTIAPEVLLALVGLVCVAICRRRDSICNDFTGAKFWGGVFVLEGLFFMIGGLVLFIGIVPYLVLFIFVFLPLVAFGGTLMGWEQQHGLYLKEVDDLLACLVRKRVFAKMELHAVLAKNNPKCSPDRAGYILRDLSAGGVLCFEECEDKIVIAFLMPYFNDMLEKYHWSCLSCGGANEQYPNVTGVFKCEYCGGECKC